MLFLSLVFAVGTLLQCSLMQLKEVVVDHLHTYLLSLLITGRND